jgi:hypothetical protein
MIVSQGLRQEADTYVPPQRCVAYKEERKGSGQRKYDVLSQIFRLAALKHRRGLFPDYLDCLDILAALTVLMPWC